MSTPYDRLVAGGAYPALLSPYRPTPPQRKFRFAHDPAVPVVDATNVADYYFRGTGQEVWGPDAFPNLAPPWERFVVCWTPPPVIVSDEHGIVPYSGPSRSFVALFRTTRADEDGWVVEVELFGEFAQGFGGPLGVLSFPLNADGSIVCDSHAIPQATGNYDPAVEHDEGLRRQAQIFQTSLDPALLCVSFLHCRNVQLEERVPDPKRARAAAKRGRALHRFHVLHVHTVAEILDREGNAQEVGLKRALHVCRGHFKDYRQRGLFGRHHDIYWWGPQLRGNAEHGTVTKRYAVHPPD